MTWRWTNCLLEPVSVADYVSVISMETIDIHFQAYVSHLRNFLAWNHEDPFPGLLCLLLFNDNEKCSGR